MPLSISEARSGPIIEPMIAQGAYPVLTGKIPFLSAPPSFPRTGHSPVLSWHSPVLSADGWPTIGTHYPMRHVRGFFTW